METLDNSWVVLKYEFDKVWSAFSKEKQIDDQVISTPQTEFWSVQDENGLNMVVNVTREYAKKFVEDMHKSLGYNRTKDMVIRRQYYKY